MRLLPNEVCLARGLFLSCRALHYPDLPFLLHTSLRRPLAPIPGSRTTRNLFARFKFLPSRLVSSVTIPVTTLNPDLAVGAMRRQ